MTTSVTATNGKEHTSDPQENVTKGAIKFDGGKSPVFRGAVAYFPRAISAVAEVSAFGASKYAWNGWQSVPDGYNRYSDAMVRHLGYEGTGEVLDPDSGLLHAAHTAWNALARLELTLVNEEQHQAWLTSEEAKDLFEYALFRAQVPTDE